MDTKVKRFMDKYSKEFKDNMFVFNDLEKDVSLKVEHYDEEGVFDVLFVDERFDVDFVAYIVRELKKTDDILTLYSTYDSHRLESKLDELGMKVSNYQYCVEGDVSSAKGKYEIEDALDDVAKDYYLGNINEYARKNYRYLYGQEMEDEYGSKWFREDEQSYRVYKKNGKIVGVVDYQVFEKSEGGHPTNEVFDVADSVCIRALFGEDEDTMKDILRDLSSVYNKRIIVNVTHSEKMLKEALVNLNGKFAFCQFVNNLLVQCR